MKDLETRKPHVSTVRLANLKHGSIMLKAKKLLRGLLTPVKNGPKIKNETGNRYGRLLVLSPAGNQLGRVQWECQCDCGQIAIVSGCALRGGGTKSCGCISIETTKANRTTHGATANYTRPPEYKVYAGIKRRCYNRNEKAYPFYGGRGIKMCERWRNDFAAFLSDMGPRPSDKHSIDRFPNHKGDYEPSNCRWATFEQQMNNRQNNRIVEYQGSGMTIAQLSRKTGINYHTLYRIIVTNGMNADSAIAT